MIKALAVFAGTLLALGLLALNVALLPISVLSVVAHCYAGWAVAWNGTQAMLRYAHEEGE